MGSREMAAKLWLLSLLVLSAYLAAAQELSENEIIDEAGEVGEEVIRPISEEKRRERLRSFFTRRREESIKSSQSEASSDDDNAKEASTQRTRSRFVRPRVTTAAPEVEDDDDLEGFSTEKVSVSISKSVSTSVERRLQPISKVFNRRKPEEEDKPETESSDEAKEDESAETPTEVEEERPRNRFTQRKRFRLFKTPARNRDRGSLVEKVLENIDRQNEIDSNDEDRRIRFRPSIRRENIRKKVQKAVGSEEDIQSRPKPRIRLPGQIRERLTTTTVITTTPTAPPTTAAIDITVPEQEPIEIVTQPIVSESETLPTSPQLLDEVVGQTFAPSTIGFFPTLPSFVPVTTEEPTTTTTTTTQKSRISLFRRKGPKRFRPKLRAEEINEIEDDAKESFRFKLPRRLNKFQPSGNSRRRPVAPVTAEPVTTTAPVTTTTELPATTRAAFTFFGSDSSPTPSTVVEVEEEEPIRLRQPAFQTALLNEAPRSSGSEKAKLTPSALSPAQPVVFQPNSLFQSFVPIRQPAVFTQNIELKPQPQAVRVAPQPQPLRVVSQPQAPVRVAQSQAPVRLVPQPQRVPQPQPVRGLPPPVRQQPVRAQPPPVRQQPQPVRSQPQPAPVRAQPQPAPVRASIFPSFELPDFFRIPFVAFRSLDSSSQQQQTPTAAATAAATAPQQPGGALFNSIGLPSGQVPGFQGPTNLNVLSGSYSYSVGLGRR